MNIPKVLIPNLFLLLTSTPLMAEGIEPDQKLLETRQARDHIGEVRTVCGRVRTTSVIPVRGRPTSLSFGKGWPDQDLTVFVWTNVREKLGMKAERLPGKDVCVIGQIDRDGNSPVVHVTNPEQIVRVEISKDD